MANISDQIKTKGYGQAIVGTGPDGNYGYGQCYGDLSSLDCTLCYAEARTVLPQCYPYNGGMVFLDGCFMRAENYSFFDEFTGPNDKAVCGNSTQKGQNFQDLATKAVLDTTAAAIRDGGYAKAEVKGLSSRNESVYVLADCWKILNPSSCKACLQEASALTVGCMPWSEGRALKTGCFMRYSDIDFLNKEQTTESLKVSPGVLVISILSSLAVVGVGVVVGMYIWRRRRIQRKRRGSDNTAKMVKSLVNSSLNFKYSTLEKATGSFNNANKLGQGGFGTVYKGVLGDGREIAVKRLFFNNKHRAADFYNEVHIISCVEHKNLVRLLGCSCSGPESLLVYEFLPNKSLDRFIFDPIRGMTLNWEKRFDIITGTAEGLVYLHENAKIRIIHRDIKCSNILLDSKLRAKIADFGLARSFQEDKRHISTAIAGTLGYMAPEYLAHGQLTEKADVYSFGVLLIEIVTGRQNTRGKTSDYSDSLVTTVWKHFQLGRVEEIIDPKLTMHAYDNKKEIKEGILRVVQVALLCSQEVPSLRPSMSTILHMLSQKDELLPLPANPPFMDEKRMELNDFSEDQRYRFNANSSHSVATAFDGSLLYAR
ncbi:hypothetical protein C5167_035250 [Papaver somniferum]|uniref:Cysteine-rich receptor-like protein kinase 2 n=1 Tax=Papaver somniferum TaxID=3469 RepID=A0A4Y7KJ25_PAPSO|nr:cysteine-rich receptor-like protein kinase 2 [Papaver somniferum]RZC72068.1 hypothetical protein C5167_035250 [Papaver somniferum]